MDTQIFKRLALDPKGLPDFKIEANGPVSQAFKKINCFHFSEAAEFVVYLPYRRNENKDDLLSVFTDGCGTCSTKHALLKLLAEENNFEDLKLMLGIFKMNGINTPELFSFLVSQGLEFIPEAHNYLRYNGKLFDLTKPGFMLAANEKDLLVETELLPHQINTYKIKFHRDFLKNWLQQNGPIKLSQEELWTVREKCISILEGNRPDL